MKGLNDVVDSASRADLVLTGVAMAQRALKAEARIAELEAELARFAHGEPPTHDSLGTETAYGKARRRASEWCQRAEAAESRARELEAKLEAKDRAHADVVAALEARLCRLSGGN